MTEAGATSLSMSLTDFVADLLSSGSPIICHEDITRTQELATGHTFTVYSGLFKDRVIAVKYFNFIAPQDMFSSVSMEIEAETLRENLANASHEIRIMTNNVLRRCPSIATLEGVFFETEDSAWIRPALIMERAHNAAPALPDLLRVPQAPIVKCSLVNNVLDGLYALHSVRICHGDIKPDNVLIFCSSSNRLIPYQARISDF
jgi:serine/threonine protein kinase